MHHGAPLVPQGEAPIPMQPRMGPFDDPAGAAESAAMRLSPLGQQGGNAAVV